MAMPAPNFRGLEFANDVAPDGELIVFLNYRRMRDHDFALEHGEAVIERGRLPVWFNLPRDQPLPGGHGVRYRLWKQEQMRKIKLWVDKIKAARALRECGENV